LAYISNKQLQLLNVVETNKQNQQYSRMRSEETYECFSHQSNLWPGCTVMIQLGHTHHNLYSEKQASIVTQTQPR